MSQVIDGRGHLFSRFNVIDVAVLIVIVIVVPMTYVAYRTFRQPLPVITSIKPSTLSVDSPRRVRLEGLNFRPYLNAFVARTNEPYSIPSRFPETVQAIFLIETPTVVELQLPNVAPGTYDIYLYDEGREVAHRTAAFTLTAGERPAVIRLGEPVPDVAVVDIEARFEVDPQIAALVKSGDLDLNRPSNGHPASTPAKILSIKKVDAPGDVDLRLTDDGRLAASVRSTRVTLTALVRLGVSPDHGVWVYADGQLIRAGEGFAFATAEYLIRGVIVRTAAVRPVKVEPKAR